jgi:hypothetical protein
MPATRYPTLFAMAVTLACPVTQATEWSFEPAVNTKIGYDDNIFLSTDNEIDSTELTLAPSAKFSVRTPRSGLSGTLGFTFRRYPEHTDRNDNNIRFDVASYHQMQRSRFGLSAGVIKDSTLDTQLEETGLVFDHEDRLRQSVSPSWGWRINELTNLETGYDYSTVEYEKSGDRTDYFTHVGQIALIRNFSETVAGNIGFVYGVTDSESDIRSTNSNMRVGLVWAATETFSASLAVGGRYTVSKYPQTVPVFSGPDFVGLVDTGKKTEASSSGVVYNVSLDRKFERSSMTLSASRNISNSAAGIQVEVTRFGISTSYNFTELVSGSLGLIMLESKDTGDNPTGNIKQNNLSGNANITWKLARFWQLSAGYGQKRQTFDTIDQDAIKNTAYLTLTYHWPRISISR